LATLSLGDAFFLGDASFLGDACRRFERKKIKTKNQGKVFLELLFSFIRVTSLKNPEREKECPLQQDRYMAAYISQLK